MKTIFADIFLNDRFYGTLRVPNKWGDVFLPTAEELSSIVETRLPLLKNKNYKIKI